ncbi:MAG TPA: enoyl-CoA hydratase-related protein [Macromonas sp.]|nr:enoyl-CoA hydratase-related protein [Macromonas sp.]
MSYPQRSADATQAVHYWRDGAVAHIRFNRPDALNAINVPVAQGFLAACRAIAADPEVRAVLITGEGRAFMAGGDLAAMQADPQAGTLKLIDGMHGALRLLADLQAPVVASVHGAVMGAALGVILGCDLVIAAEGTKFGFAYSLVGACCDCSTSWGLPRVVGWRKAMELALLAEPFDAAEAQRLGLVNRLVPAAALAAETDALMQRLSSGPTVAFGLLKRLMRSSHTHDLPTHLDMEAAGFMACTGTQDFAEGIGAFLERRKPVFTGR